MAIARTSRATINSSADATSYATSAFTPSANVLLIAGYNVERGSSTNPTTPTLSGHGTWVTIVDFPYRTTGAARSRMCLFACDTGASPGSSTLTFDHAGVTMVGAEASVFELSGTDLASSGGSSTVSQCFVQFPTTVADSSGTSASITLSAAGNSNNRPFAFFSHVAGEATTPQTSWTEIDDVNHGSPATGTESQERLDVFDTAAGASWTTSAVYGGIAWEIKALAGAIPVIPFLKRKRLVTALRSAGGAFPRRN